MNLSNKNESNPIFKNLFFNSRISTENGTALYPNDFTNLQNVGTFASGATNAATIPFSISISDDDIVENVENFFVQLSAVDTALQISNPGRATVSIVDNDGKQIKLFLIFLAYHFPSNLLSLFYF